MIKVNDQIVEINHYPDGTPRINIDMNPIPSDRTHIIVWNYEGDEEIFYLMLIKKHLENFDLKATFFLILKYIPNARMDRVKSKNEVFTLKYFCEFINSLNFDGVYVLDAHSDVSLALLNRCVNGNPKRYINKAINGCYDKDKLVLYFPDAGSMKRYSGMFPEIRYCYGEKNRDWKTGMIQGLEIRTNGLDLEGKDVLMIDDIISFGGSLYYSALELKKRGVEKIYAYASHTENSVLNKEKGTLIKLLEDGTVERLFTTDSLFTGEHEKITVMEE